MALVGLLLLLLTPAQDAFLAIPLDRVGEAARREQKPALLYVHTRWQQLPGAILDDARVRAVLAERCVAVRVDLAEHEDFAAQHAVARLPLFMLVDSAGLETDRIIPFGSAGDVERELLAALSGIDAEGRARALLERMGPQNPFARERLAEALARRGKRDEALREYLWLLDDAFKNVMFAAARRDLVCADLARLGADSPVALEALRARRQAWAEGLLRGSDDANVARNVAAADRALDEPQATLALFDLLSEKSRARQVLFDRVIDQLVDARRYAEALRPIDPLESFELQLQLAGRGGGLACCSLHAARGPGATTPLIERGARLAEAAAALRFDEQARKLVERTLSVEDTPAARRVLRTRLERVGRGELLPAPVPASSAPAPPAQASLEGSPP